MDKKLKEKLPGGKFKNVPIVRSRTMSKIRSKGNKTTEVMFRLALVRAGIKGWVLHPKEIIGKPDFFFPRKRITVFVDGCYWHGCPKCGHIPKTRTEYWSEKIKINKARDKKVNRLLKKENIEVIRFWEHEIKADLKGCVIKLKSLLKKGRRN